MRNKLLLIIGGLIFAIIIIICIILGMPKEDENKIFSFEEPILYIKSHAIISQNTDFESLNKNYTSLLVRNGLSPESISLFLKNHYKQKDNIYFARFISEYKDTYMIGFNLDTNEVSLRKITEEELKKEILNTKEAELY